jgi:hypothetical protein
VLVVPPPTPPTGVAPLRAGLRARHEDEVIVRDWILPLLAKELPGDQVIHVRRQRALVAHVVQGDGARVLLAPEDEVLLPLAGDLLPPGRK